MHLVEDDELHVTDKVGSFVQHASQDLGRHLHVIRDSGSQEDEETDDQAAALGIDLHISSEDTDSRRIECRLEISEFLIRQGFDG